MYLLAKAGVYEQLSRPYSYWSDRGEDTARGSDEARQFCGFAEVVQLGFGQTLVKLAFFSRFVSSCVKTLANISPFSASYDRKYGRICILDGNTN